MLRQSAKRLHALVAEEALLERLASGKLASSSSNSAFSSLASVTCGSSSAGLMSALSISLRQQGGLLLVRRGVHSVAKHQLHGPSLPLRPSLFTPAQEGTGGWLSRFLRRAFCTDKRPRVHHVRLPWLRPQHKGACSDPLQGRVQRLEVVINNHGHMYGKVQRMEAVNNIHVHGKVQRLEVVNNNRVRVYVRADDSGFSELSQGPSQGGVYKYHFQIGSTDALERKLDEAQRELQVPAERHVPVKYVNEVSMLHVLLDFAPTLLLLGATYWLISRQMRQMTGGLPGRPGAGGKNQRGSSGPGGFFGMGKANTTTLDKGATKVTFKDVAGCDEAKLEIMEFVQFLQNPDKFKNLGAKLPKGALLVGPPGSGKTLLAKATAGEAGVPFLSISGSDFQEMFVGVGPARVRDLFAQARSQSPSMLFIDEIDAIGRQRGRGGAMVGRVAARWLNRGVHGMGGGRCLHHYAGQRVHLKGLKLVHPIEYYAQRLAALSPGMAGADIANVCNEAALVMIGKISTGATNDLERVTQLAYSQVAVYGMNEKIGLLSYRMDRDQFDKPYSNETAQMIDHEVRTFVDAAYKRTVAMVEEKKELIQAMATTLLEKEVINFDDVERLLGKRPFGSDHVRNIDRFRFGGDGTPPAASEDGAKEGASPSDSGSSGGDGGGPAGEPAIEEQGTLVERLRRRLEPGAVVAV
ncbi:ATP-dependent zinc metalloprotease FTSH 3, mitochondrial-like protein [Dunaliella salina]|uniref:ATP-dependent zinc metalloprotease FTSH 3, mitochondrial-like protein n=2 Tax=Dunaliella salina TaxID=3046 RepID=A0ABQ7GT79_DUNSA|nr:ATP-dependent zinc metalloprotease FTSH 3, mitochondrial-like protein [Dunaliella salina]|eukprot:KAF5837820.1 ATP-dependent zinc metalloprotease FTSH 3, mitochondrial-like protein [Dunaliella salina]